MKFSTRWPKNPKTILLSAVIISNIFSALGQAHAETAASGLGVTSCAQIIRMYDTEPTTSNLIVTAYLSGFFTGINVNNITWGGQSRDISLTQNMSAVESGVRRRCNLRRNDALWLVAMDWYFELSLMTQ